VKIEGVDLQSLSDDHLAICGGSAGMVFQFYNLIPRLRPGECGDSDAVQGRRAAARRSRAFELLERVGLKIGGSQALRTVRGEQQRVSIARALANEPALVLLDEPTGDLDSATGAEVIGLLRDLNRREQVTLVIATHDHTIAEQSSRL